MLNKLVEKSRAEITALHIQYSMFSSKLTSVERVKNRTSLMGIYFVHSPRDVAQLIVLLSSEPWVSGSSSDRASEYVDLIFQIPPNKVIVSGTI